jgi:hypothetical protein
MALCLVIVWVLGSKPPPAPVAEEPAPEEPNEAAAPTPTPPRPPSPPRAPAPVFPRFRAPDLQEYRVFESTVNGHTERYIRSPRGVWTPSITDEQVSERIRAGTGAMLTRAQLRQAMNSVDGMFRSANARFLEIDRSLEEAFRRMNETMSAGPAATFRTTTVTAQNVPTQRTAAPNAAPAPEPEPRSKYDRLLDDDDLV